MRLLIITQKVDQNDQLLGFSVGWFRRFAEKFDSLIILCLEKGEFDLPENVKVISLGKDRGASKLGQLFDFYKNIWSLRRQYDAVFVFMNAIWMVVGAWPWRFLGKKVFLWYAHKTIKWKHRLAEKFADGIFTSTPEGFRIRSEKVMVVGQGIDTELFKPNHELRIMNHGLIKILSVGRIALIKNYEVLLKAAKILSDRNIDFSVTIIGEPVFPEDVEYEKRLKNVVSEMALEQKISFLGRVTHKDLPSYYQSSHIFVNLGKTGSLDKTIVEAMASGTVVISSNDAAIKFLPKELVVDNNDPKDLAEKIQWAIRLNDVQRAAIAGDLRKIVIRNHSLNGLINKIKQVLVNFGSSTSEIKRVLEENSDEGDARLSMGEIYNEKVKNKYGGDYERGRWFKNSISKAGYEMTLESIKKHILDGQLHFKDNLELGPGPGTWTKIFIEKNNSASFDLVDISSEMLKLARENFKDYGNIRYFEADFLDFKPDKNYDLFFSSRALEYIKDKNSAVKKISELLKSGGQGFIITKTPHYFRSKLRSRKMSEIHKSQISPDDFKKVLDEAGFTDVAIYPVTMIFPLLRSATMNKLLYKIFGGFKLNPISKLFSESYCIKFYKS